MLNLFIGVTGSNFVLMKTKFEVDCVKSKFGKFDMNRCKGVENFNKVCGNGTVRNDVCGGCHDSARTLQTKRGRNKIKFAELSD